MINPNKCSIKGCNRTYALLYLGNKICGFHWESITDKELAREGYNTPKEPRQTTLE